METNGRQVSKFDQVDRVYGHTLHNQSEKPPATKDNEIWRDYCELRHYKKCFHLEVASKYWIPQMHTTVQKILSVTFKKGFLQSYHLLLLSPCRKPKKIDPQKC